MKQIHVDKYRQIGPRKACYRKLWNVHINVFYPFHLCETEPFSNLDICESCIFLLQCFFQTLIQLNR